MFYCDRAYLLLIFMITILREIKSVRIVKLAVPEVVQSGSTGALLECHYATGDTVDAAVITVQWLFNHRDVIYQWSSGSHLNTATNLEGRMDLRQQGLSLMNATFENYLPLHLVNLVPEQSGEYTCVVDVNGTEVRETKPMLVFSPEEELDLKIEQVYNGIEVKCSTRGLYPQPELTIEVAGQAVARQQLRVWREGALFAAESAAALPGAGAARAALACRLQLAPAGYTAIKRANHVTGGRHQSRGSSSSSKFLINIMSLIVLITTLRYFCV